jgi:OmpA-OmpF porin, OOP family
MGLLHRVSIACVGLAVGLVAAGALFNETRAQSASSKDHPLVGRFEDAKLVFSRTYQFDEVRLISGPIDPERVRDPKPRGFTTVEGRSHLYYYVVGRDRAPAEVIRSYRASLERQGFAFLYQCTTQDTSCVTVEFPEIAVHMLAEGIIPRTSAPKLQGNDVASWFTKQGRYLLAHLDRPDGQFMVSIGVGEGPQGTAAVVQVVEAAAFKPGVILGLKRE